ncbi:peptidase inhibitor family I36 protein [Streptomyces sp. DSM 15324]|uniref:peptidase inhibitor family I36 protein n=1 Tax=Streptomyces sp. DSM 15324 TaxID=1739111 RepID=UPI00099F0918|nr:peptidase inhibitor family I36 protein [Streptomyces sp. DSM 15324]
MSFKLKAVTAISAVALSFVGVTANASPAQAVGGCPSGKLCLYAGTDYTKLWFTAASTNACYRLLDYGLWHGVKSYVNNLPVNAVMYYFPRTPLGTIRPGGFSSDTGNSLIATSSEIACMGAAQP